MLTHQMRLEGAIQDVVEAGRDHRPGITGVDSDPDAFGEGIELAQRCPLVDRQIRAATVGMEPYQNINTAIAAGFQQITPYVPGQGRHMVRGGVAGLSAAHALGCRGWR